MMWWVPFEIKKQNTGALIASRPLVFGRQKMSGLMLSVVVL